MKTNTTYNIGERIRELRVKCNLSQEQLALQSEISTTYLGLLERNQKNPTIATIERLCDSLNISLVDFFSNQTGSGIEEANVLSAQILAYVRNCTDEEKMILLNLTKGLLNLRTQPTD